jgi:anti-sigma factor RsiW
MTQCWTEGELRAWLDGELPAPEMERLSAHLAECSECAKALGVLRLRASRVSALLDELAEPVFAGEKLIAFPAKPVARSKTLAVWGSVAAAVAACFLFAVVAMQNGAHRGGVRRPMTSTPSVPALSAPAESAVEAPAPQYPPVRRNVRKRYAQPMPAPRAPKRPDVQYFMALDNEPIDSGVVMRVALGPAEAPADVLYSLDGRARAVRLVSDSVSGGRK